MSMITVPTRRTLGAMPSYWSDFFRGIRGLGDNGDGGGDVFVGPPDPFVGPVNQPDPTDPNAVNWPSGAIAYDTTTGQYEYPDTVPSTTDAPPGSTVQVGTEGLSASQIAALIAPLAAAGLKILQANTLPAGTMVLPNGTVVHQTAGYPVTSTTGVTGTISSTLLLIGVIGLGAALLLSRN